jgi:hypothetical protein
MPTTGDMEYHLAEPSRGVRLNKAAGIVKVKGGPQAGIHNGLMIRNQRNRFVSLS